MEETDNKGQVEEVTGGETPVETVQDAPSGADGAADAEAFVPDDSMLERAVKAGMSLADAKALPSKAFAERMLSALEGKGGNGGNGADGGGDAIPAIDFSNFGEEHGYDPNLSKAMNSLKATVEYQAKVIAKLMKAEKSPKQTNAKAVEARRNLTIARPGGEGGNRRETPENAESEVLSALKRKFGLN